MLTLVLLLSVACIRATTEAGSGEDVSSWTDISRPREVLTDFTNNLIGVSVYQNSTVNDQLPEERQGRAF